MSSEVESNYLGEEIQVQDLRCKEKMRTETGHFMPCQVTSLLVIPQKTASSSLHESNFALKLVKQP